MKRQLITSAALLLALSACSGPEPQPEQDTSPSGSATRAAPTTSPTSLAPTASAPPATSESSNETPAAQAPETPIGQPTQVPEAPPAQAPADDGMTTSLQEFLTGGGVCFSDYFPAGPPTDAALKQIQEYCATQTPEPNYEYLPAQEDSSSEVSQCESLDPNTASSGAIQHCYLEHGIDVHAP